MLNGGVYSIGLRDAEVARGSQLVNANLRVQARAAAPAKSCLAECVSWNHECGKTPRLYGF